jgi:hypothetical protein
MTTRLTILLLVGGLLAGCTAGQGGMGQTGMMYDRYGGGASGGQTGELKVPAQQKTTVVR